jgi:hypothetical protein
MRAAPTKYSAAIGDIRYSVIVAIGAFVLAHWLSAPALACGPSDQPYRVVQEVLPADGAKGIPRNGAIQVQLQFVYPNPRVTTPWEQPRVRLVRVSDSVEVMGVLETAHFESMHRITWAPLALLAANTVYRVEVTSMPSHRADIEGKISSTTTFETSEDIAPEIELTGELQVALRAEWVSKLNCRPCSCAQTSERRRALMADFTLPQVAAGFADYGYTAWLGQSDREPPVFDGPGSGETRFDADGKYLALAPGAHEVVTTEVFPETTITCLNFNVWDAARQAKSGKSICMPRSEINRVLATLDTVTDGGPKRAADGGVADDEDAGEPRSADASEIRHSKANSHKASSPSAGCAVGMGSTAPGMLACMLMATFLLGVRRRRRL